MKRYPGWVFGLLVRRDKTQQVMLWAGTSPSWITKTLNRIEVLGNRLPDPAIIFLLPALCEIDRYRYSAVSDAAVFDYHSYCLDHFHACLFWALAFRWECNRAIFTRAGSDLHFMEYSGSWFSEGSWRLRVKSSTLKDYSSALRSSVAFG